MIIPALLYCLVLFDPPAATNLFPASAGRGQTIDVEAVGKIDAWPVQVWVDEPGLILVPKEEKGKFTATIAADAAPGLRRVRLYDARGATARLAFAVGVLGESAEVEPNDEAAKPQVVASLPAVIAGRLAKRGDVDAFGVTLAKGQTLVAAVEARSLGSPMDAVLQVASPDGFVLDQIDDAPTLDPVLAFTAPADGSYVVRLFAFPSTPGSSISFAGGDPFVYRLTLTTSGLLQQTLPLAIGTDEPALVRAIGRGLPDAFPPLHPEPAAGRGFLRAWHPSTPGVVLLPIVDAPGRVEPDSAGPHPLPTPGHVSGRLDRDGDEDAYRIELKKDQAIQLRVMARTLGSPLDPLLVVRDASGAAIAERDDAEAESVRDVDLEFKAPADGPFDLVVRDRHGRGGPLAVYRLDATFPRPDFALAVADDRITVAPGKPAEVEIRVARRDGHEAPIAIEAPWLPPGLTAAPVTSEPKGDTSRRVKLKIEAAEGAAAFSGPIALIGRSGDLARPVLAGDDLGPPDERLWLTVVK